MTDKVVNAGIEDVLSSIKRLVGEEGRKVPDLISSTPKRKPGKLVLTDALRVSKIAVGEENNQASVNDTGYRAEDSVKPMLLRACDIVRHEEPANEEQTETDPESDLADSLSSKIEALEAAIARTEDQWEPDGDSDDAYSGTPTTSREWGAQQEFAEADVKNAGEPNADVKGTGEPEAEVEAEQTEHENMAMFIRDPDVFSLTSAELPDDQDQQVSLNMDEGALRDLIAQVVREELQGVLGERITRNVRKMVRREIYRALAEQKLD
ncbi:hypothetical protein [Ruegeria halocynthiae]|uniref:hypothetical protein n=1 Tax=Ruegeria halocynthiae TaxID=985054 RepID=UPI00056B5FE7|nr:hypothetical protein [Ruegeria halocynthiae]